MHESFLRLVDAADLQLADRKHFFAYAAKTMRNIVIDAARAQLAARRGGGQADIALDTELANDLPADDGGETLVQIHDALLELEALDPELAQVVEMRYFAGLQRTRDRDAARRLRAHRAPPVGQGARLPARQPARVSGHASQRHRALAR